MKAKQTLHQYLEAQGVSEETSAEEIARHKQAYQRLYHQQYYHERKQNEKRFSLRLKPHEYQQLKSYAGKHEKKLGVFIKQAALAYLEQGYVPRNAEAIEHLQKDIRKAGHNINQIVHSIHRNIRWSELSGKNDVRIALEEYKVNYEKLVTKVSGLTARVESYFVTPPVNVADALWEIVRANPEKIPALRQLLNDMENTMHDADD